MSDKLCPYGHCSADSDLSHLIQQTTYYTELASGLENVLQGTWNSLSPELDDVTDKRAVKRQLNGLFDRAHDCLTN